MREKKNCMLVSYPFSMEKNKKKYIQQKRCMYLDKITDILASPLF